MRLNCFLKVLPIASTVVGATLALLTGIQSAKAESLKLIWSEDFNASLSNQQWNIYNDTPFAASQNACFMESNTYTRNGVLNLVINKNRKQGCSSRPYASGGLDTYTYQAQTYGRWEVRAKMPKGYGAVGYIGLFPVDGSWPPEIDFAEVLGKQPKTVYLTQHYGTAPNQQQDSFATSQTSVDWTAGYHTYVLDWVPGQLRYYIDGVLQATQAQQFTATPAMMKLAIGTGTGNCGSWFGCPSEATPNGSPSWVSTTMQIDYVKIYQYIP
jgi:beta-glucanase (GH16 family)